MNAILSQEQAVSIVRALLPAGAEVEYVEHPARRPAVLVADLDGDGVPELAGAYRMKDVMYAFIAKYGYGQWQAVHSMKGVGFGIANMMAAPIVAPGTCALLIGWQIGAIWAQLDMWQFDRGNYAHLTPYDLFYGKLEVEDMPGSRGQDGQCEIALWVHDTGEAYHIEVLRWNGRRLAADPDAYPYYFGRKVVPYYEKLVRDYPEAQFYADHLAMAKEKASI
ncbi:hypothetical protein [Cohnella sp. GCM10027633]|uniref:hypothetical protein n=1 Tax=unclassified Cohnella TaxID=2636738 RepID=UPI003640B392